MNARPRYWMALVIVILIAFAAGCSSKPRPPEPLPEDQFMECETKSTPIAVECFEDHGGPQLPPQEATKLYSICENLAMRVTEECFNF